jgi:uncharacterized UBP type Zn finger protein
MSAPTVNADALRQLTAMGFSEGQAKVALLRANNDVNFAAELISNGRRKCVDSY